MDFFLIILGILWVAVAASNKQKRKQAQAEAARRNAQMAAEMEAAAAPEAEPPVQQTGRFDPYTGRMVAQEAPAPAAPVAQQPVFQQSRGQIAASFGESVLQAPQTRTRAAMTAQVHASNESRHTLEASSLTGHSHVESSLTGLAADCPPESQLRRSAGATVAACVDSGASIPFEWNASEVARGLILSEILGKPKALQRRA